MISSDVIVEPAPAKLNLALHVRARRADGYHDLETLFVFCRDGDVVTIADAQDDSFTITGPFASALAAAVTDVVPADRAGWADNLVTRAADGFRATFDVAQRHAIIL